MRNKTLMASALAVLLAGVASSAIAQDATSGPAAPAAPPANATPHQHHGGSMHDDFHGDGMREHGMHGHDGFGGPGMGVISDLDSLEHLYMASGRGREMESVYNDVLAKSKDPRVRTFAYHELARLQSRPQNVDAAIATLRKSLDENLANEARMHDMMEKMHSEWMQHHPQASVEAQTAPTL